MLNDFTTNYWIDHVQSTKKTMVDTLVKDEKLSAPLHAFIEAQTAFTKTAVKSMSEFANASGETFAKVVK
ncbi:MAG: hypothetical protein HOM88_03115 [Hellea sp.]|jgi:hypothetical protein|nr:hypothetical protein [Hellea sp.]